MVEGADIELKAPKAAVFGLLALVGVTAGLSAGLLFVIEPFVARLVLPTLGGSPGVWNTCMLFFQATLLAGYGFTHLTTRLCSRRVQLGIHGLVVLLPIAVLNFTWSGAPAHGSDPTLWLLGTLALHVGPPFFALATASPLLQRWLVGTDLTDSVDPYVLYAASNAGSLIGLLSYPVVIEGAFTLSQQRTGVSVAYAAFGVLVVCCGLLAQRRAKGPDGVAEAVARAAPEGNATRLTWLALAAIPSSLLLGATQHLSTDVAAAPLLWVIPLALYLVSFIVAFSARAQVSLWLWSRGFAACAMAIALAFLIEARTPIVYLMLLHLAALFFACMVCHQRLADSRPEPSRLTEFYLWLSLGGVLGGTFNVLVAPLIFDSVLEYPIALVLVCLACEGDPELTPKAKRILLGVAAGVTLWMLGLHVAIDQLSLSGTTVQVLRNALPVLAVYGCSRSPRVMALVLAVLLATADLAPQGHQRRLYAERSFFGVVQVVLDREGRYTVLLHGTTFHGLQAIAPEDHDRPTLYYHPSGPVGKIMASLDATRPKGPPLEVGVVGLGVGAIAAYGKPGQRFTFFEIDPAVARIASNPQFFTHLSRSKAETRIVLGDGRLTLAEEDDGAFDLLVLDAFASDSIPVHLLTREALALYVRKLRGPQSLLAFHVSNRHVPLGGVLAAHAADLGLKAWAIEDVTTERQRAQGKEGSLWIVLSPSGSSENAQAGWIPLVANPESPRWTDDFSNVFELMKWF